MIRRIALATAIAVMASGCSFVFVRGDVTDEREPQRWPVCTEHVIWPAVDLAYAALAGAGTIALLDEDDGLERVGLIVSIPAMVGYGIATIYGFTKTSRCRDARAAYERAADEGR